MSDEPIIVPPPVDVILCASDVLALMGNHAAIERFEAMMAPG